MSDSRSPAGTGTNRAGFGTTLIRRTATHDLLGSAELDFAPGGLKADITFPVT